MLGPESTTHRRKFSATDSKAKNKFIFLELQLYTYQCEEWMKSILENRPIDVSNFPGENYDIKPFYNSLCDGTKLCSLLNILGIVVPVYPNCKAGDWHARDNIANFLDGLRKIGLSDTVLFEPDELFSARNYNQVASCLLFLSRVFEKQRGFRAPPMASTLDSGSNVLSSPIVPVLISESDQHNKPVTWATNLLKESISTNFISQEQVIQLIDQNHYNITNIPFLESFVLQQLPTPVYDSMIYPFLIKLYQFYPNKARFDITSVILLKALTLLPQPEFINCFYILPSILFQNENIQNILSLLEAFNSCNFEYFWNIVKSNPVWTELLPHWTGSMQDVFAELFHITYKSFNKENFQNFLKLNDNELHSLFSKHPEWNIQDQLILFPLSEKEQHSYNHEIIPMERVAPIINNLI